MPYKDAEKQKEANKEAAKRYRQGMTKEAVIPDENITPAVIPIEHSVYQCIMSSGAKLTPAILDALIDKDKRKKLEAICASLHSRNKMDRVYYGISGLTMADVSELLEATD